MAKTDDKTQEKNTLTTSGRKKLVKAICQTYHEKLDARAPKVKRDLNYNEIKDVMYLNDDTKSLFKKLFMDDEINTRDSLDKWRIDTIAKFQQYFKFDASDEDTEDIQIELSGDYEKWYKKNFPYIDKRISPATIRVSDFLTYMGTVKKEATLPNLIKDGVIDLTTWKVKDLKMEALNSCREFLKTA